MILSIITPEKLNIKIAEKAKQMRLSQDLSRETLAERSGVPAPTIRHFENTGKISLPSLCRIAWVLDSMKDFEQLFNAKPIIRIEDINKKTKSRGRK